MTDNAIAKGQQFTDNLHIDNWEYNYVIPDISIAICKFLLQIGIICCTIIFLK